MDSNQAAAATLFIVSGTNALDVYSATNSSPWTAYKFANDPQSVAAMRRYVAHAIAITALINGAGAIIARSWLPILGAAAASAYMYWLYEEAVNRGQNEESKSWQQKV